MKFRSACWVLAVGASCSTRLAAADDVSPRVSLSWSAPSECPDELALTQRIEALIGQSLRDAGEQSLSVTASAQGDSGHGYAAKVVFTSPQGTDSRYLEHPQCEHLVQALALLIALSIDPQRVRATQSEQAVNEAAAAPSAPFSAPSASEPAQMTPAKASAAKREVAAPARTAPRGSPRGARVAVHGLLGAGPLPDFGVGVGAELGFHQRGFRAEVLGRYWGSREQLVSSAASASIDLQLATLGGRGCWLPLLGPWQIAACAGGDLGPLSAQGQGVQNPRQRSALYADVVGGLELAYTPWRLSPEAGLEISGALARPRFGLVEDNRGVEEFRPAAWGFSLFAGVAFEL